jgi:hypothetical protein
MLSQGKVNTRNTENFGVIPFGPNDTDQQLSEKNLHNLALSAQDEGVSPYLILAGVYDKEDGGDEEWGLEAERGEEAVKESVVDWLLERLVSDAIDDMVGVRASPDVQAPKDVVDRVNTSIQSVESEDVGLAEPMEL